MSQGDLEVQWLPSDPENQWLQLDLVLRWDPADLVAPSLRWDPADQWAQLGLGDLPGLARPSIRDFPEGRMVLAVLVLPAVRRRPKTAGWCRADFLH